MAGLKLKPRFSGVTPLPWRTYLVSSKNLKNVKEFKTEIDKFTNGVSNIFDKIFH